MKNISCIFFIATVKYFLLLIGIYKIALYEAADWDGISGIMLHGVYLFFTCLFVHALYANSKNSMKYFQNSMPSREKQAAYI